MDGADTRKWPAFFPAPMTGGRIYLQQPDGALIAFEETLYESEDLLQSLLEKYPDLLAGDQTSGGRQRRWLLIQREASIPDTEASGGRWSLDHLFVDDEGIPTLIEVKRSTDTRIRREVVGQLLDYAANALAFWPAGQLRQLFEDSESYKSGAFENFMPDMEPDTFWQTVKTNLQAGRVRLVFLADVLPNELKRIIEFLNGQMDPAEVIGIEIKQYIGRHEGNELRTLVPRLVGQTAEAEARKSTKAGPKELWTREELLRNVQDHAGEIAAANVARLLTWGEKHMPSVAYGARGGGGVHFLLSETPPYRNIASIWASGELVFWYVYAGQYASFGPQEQAELTAEIRETFPGVVMQPKRGPKIPLGGLGSEHLEALERLIQRVANTISRED